MLASALFRNENVKRQDAYESPSPVYGWVTEGSTTKDLQEAKSLLAELG